MHLREVDEAEHRCRVSITRVSVNSMSVPVLGECLKHPLEVKLSILQLPTGCLEAM